MGRNLLTQDRTQTRFGMLKRFRMPTEFRMQIHFRKKPKDRGKKTDFPESETGLRLYGSESEDKKANRKQTIRESQPRFSYSSLSLTAFAALRLFSSFIAA